MRTTVGQLLINEVLPDDLRDYTRVIDSKSIRTLLRRVATDHPEKYNEVASQLMQIGGEVSTANGREASLTLDSLRLGPEASKLRRELDKTIEAIVSTPGLSPVDRDKRIVMALGRAGEKIRSVNLAEQLKVRNPLAMQVNSGARGNPSQFSSLNVGDLLVADHRDNPIPIPITHSYSDGLDPVEYWATSYGARKGTVSTKFCLTGDTRVRMADGSLRRICDIRVGDVVIGADVRGACRPVKVLNVFDNGERECNRYVFRKNASQQYVTLTATKDHSVLAEWRSANAYDNDTSPRLRRLDEARIYARPSKNQFVAVPAGGCESPVSMSEPRAWLLGLLIGDGCLAPSTHGRVLFSCADLRLLADIEPQLVILGFKFVRTCQTQYTYHLSEVRTRSDKHTRKHPQRQWLEQVGLQGKLAHEKRLPDDVWRWNNKSVAALIGGVFSTDGSIYVRKNGGVSLKLCMTAEHVVRQIHALLEVRFGIYATPVYERPISGNMRHVQFGFSINYAECVERFASTIPLVGKKRTVLAAGLTDMPVRTRLGHRVVSASPAGVLPTYDLEVDHPDHMFVLEDGLIVANSTPKGGFLGKQLALAAHRLVVTEEDCGTENGIPVSGSDPDNVGTVLARGYGSNTAGEVITPKLSKRLGRHKTVVVRSPMTCEARSGICAKCAGVRERGRLPEIGENIGIAAAQAIAEPVSQSALNDKHTGGVVGAGTNASGFDAINQLVQVPKTFQGGAAVAKLDGRVEDIENAPQGGIFVRVDGERHYVPPGFKSLVQKGERVEAGDVISEGLPNPSDVVRYKGIGAGRWHFMNNFRATLKASKIGASRRNIELLSRGLINHVRITGLNSVGDAIPDDVVEFNTITRRYRPRPGSRDLQLKRATGTYLEKPYLQYSIGTRVTPKVMADLKDAGISNVLSHQDEPPFAPEMVRAMETISHADDWMTRLGGFHLKKGLTESVHRGRESKEHGESYIPALARGVDFGKPPVGSGAPY